MADEKAAVQPIIVKKIIKKGGGHHGGAWKVAYADFVTAMMAFFLLLWLLNVATKEQLNAISDYFDPSHPQISESVSGAGGVLGGLTVSPDGAMSSNTQSVSPTTAPPRQAGDAEGDTETDDPSEAAIEEAQRKQEEQRFEEARQQLEQEIEKSPELADLKKNLLVDMTPEGLRIQIVDQEGNSMFPSGSAKMFDKTKKLLEMVGKVVEKLPNQLSVRGHTDSSPYGSGADYTNWELSADRANASRRVLTETGLPEKRIHNVVGKSDTEPLVAGNPADPRNRRISIILLRDELVNPPKPKGSGKAGSGKTIKAAPPPAQYQKTPGAIYFP